MNLSKNLREVILENFKAGKSVMWLARIYVQRPDKIEKVIRSAIKDLESTIHLLANDAQAAMMQREITSVATPEDDGPENL